MILDVAIIIIRHIESSLISMSRTDPKEMLFVDSQNAGPAALLLSTHAWIPLVTDIKRYDCNSLSFLFLTFARRKLSM